MKTYTIVASHPTKGLINVTVEAETSVAAIATLDFGCVVITITSKTA